MAFFSGLGILSSIGGFFKGFGWKKWVVLITAAVILFTLWHYRSEVRDLTEKLNAANRQIQSLEEDLKLERFMADLDDVLVEDLDQDTDDLLDDINVDREEYVQDLDVLRERIRREVREEHQQHEEQMECEDAKQCLQEQSTRENVDDAVIDRISERMLRVYERAQSGSNHTE